MKTDLKGSALLLTVLLFSLLFNCKKEALKVAPIVTIAVATNITANSATVASTITEDGGAEVTSRGVCWNTNGDPTISDSKTSDGKGKGSFSSSLTNLNPGTSYNLKSYAINAIGTAYSSQTSFKTLALLASLTTIDASAIGSTSFSSGGNVTNNGGAEVTARGVCWSSTQNPTIAESKTTDGTGSGTFNSSVTGLTPGITYYIRSYSTNSIGTAYGNQITVITLAILPTITTTELSSITSNSASSGGNIANDGGASIIARGVCWSTSQNPTITNTKTSDATGKGVFSSSITGLTPGLTYYIRAYATNSIGTAYGNQVTTTALAILPTISTAIASEITANSALSGGTIANDGGSPVTTKGVCWSTSQNPTTASSKTTEIVSSGTFKSLMSELKSKTTYYYRAYATNKIGTSYGDELVLKTNESKLGVVDISESTNWDYWVTAKNGDSYFLKETSNKPTAILLTLSGSTVRTPIFFNQQGFPEKVIINNVVYVFDNYNGKFVDIAAILPNGTIDVVKNVETDINWDLYRQKGAALIASEVLNYTGRAIGAVPCAVKIGAAKASFGLLWAEAAWSCGTYGVSLATDIAEEEFGVSNGFTEFVNTYDAVDLVNTCLQSGGDGLDCLFSLAANSYDYLSDELRELDKRQQQIADANKILSQGFIVSTYNINSYTANSAVVGGTITVDGVATIIERGVLYSTTPSPQITGTRFQIGSGVGNFSSSLNGLTPNTTYYIIAYAKSTVTTLYGTSVSFKTAAQTLFPTLTTTVVTLVTTNSATSGGNITSDGNSAITARGVCWSTSQNPTTSNSKTTDGTGTSSFTSSITGLSSNTTYNVRAYATNDVGTAYGPQVSFTTNQTIDIPTVTTNQISSITQISATGGGIVTSDGNSTVTARGVCWSTSSNPTTSSSKTINSPGTGAFSSSITGLSANTTYYLRAYATNGKGTAYGDKVSFTTNAIQAQVPTLTTTTVSSITMTNATSGGNISSDGGATITTRGVCWSTSQNPTTSNSKTTDGTGTSSFTSSITGLSSNTTYHVRAYAINNIGTGYGGDITFTTTQSTTSSVSDVDGNTYSTIIIGSQVWMAENLKTTKLNDATVISFSSSKSNWGSLSAAYCWYNNDYSNKNTYGALYNWYGVNSGKLCPVGWHIPTNSEWAILSNYLSGNSVSGGKMKESGTAHWLSPNIGATNSSGFTALPGGIISTGAGGFNNIGSLGVWWSSTETDSNTSSHINIYNSGSDILQGSSSKPNGFSVRCLKD